jgi:hypothetical protein
MKRIPEQPSGSRPLRYTAHPWHRSAGRIKIRAVTNATRNAVSSIAVSSASVDAPNTGLGYSRYFAVDDE